MTLRPLIYQNPVWDGEFADPFVLHTQGAYYAYGTSSYARIPAVRTPAQGVKAFPVLRSTDLVHWEFAGGIIDARPGQDYWAPAVAERDGGYFLYYSAGETGDNTTHRLTVARSDDPAGPFETCISSPLLPDEGFTIDAHPFHDPVDGRWYLFFAKDFFDGRVGTGIAAVPLAESMVAPAGEVVTILRASADWQVHERNRQLYGRRWPAWHTVEGPCVIWHAGRYYCLYSGGAWRTFQYGVGYGMSEHVLGPYHDEWSVEGPVVLHSVPGKGLGPGHNSVVSGPDGHNEFIVYHAWDAAHTARRMCIDPLVWTADGPRCAIR